MISNIPLYDYEDEQTDSERVGNALGFLAVLWLVAIVAALAGG